MSHSTDLQTARANVRQDVTMGFGNLQSFELMQRAAKLLASSTLVPTSYRLHKEVKEYGKVVGYEENPAAFSNCVVALNMAQRMNADPLMIMQNLHIIEGRPSWSSAFIIAAINSCGRYSPLRFEISEAGEPTVVEYMATEWKRPQGGGKAQPTDVKKKITVKHQTCKAWAIERETGERLESPTVSIQMAIDEGWLTKNGSKWQTIPELMLRYRSASFFGRLYAPELLMGLQTAEEVHDIIDATPTNDGTIRVDVDSLRAEKEPHKPKKETKSKPVPEPADADAKDIDETVDADTGEVTANAYLDADKVLASIQRSQDHDTLGIAADSIQDCDPARQEALGAAYLERLDELDGVPHVTQEDIKPTSARTRRASAADME